MEETEPAMVAAAGGIVALLLGAAMWGLGAVTWSGDLAGLGAFDSAEGRMASALCAAIGAAGLLLSRAPFWDRL